MTPRRPGQTTESPRYASGANVVEFPADRVDRASRRVSQPAIVLILPVVRIEREDDTRERKRRAWYTMKRAMAEHFGVPLDSVHIGIDLAGCEL